MPSSLRRATVITILLGTFLIPALLEAKTPARSWAPVGRSVSAAGFFDMVWELLANMREGGAGSAPAGSFATKNGGQMDPSGTPAPAPPSGNTLTGGGGGGTGGTGDNGGQMDPSGGV